MPRQAKKEAAMDKRNEGSVSHALQQSRRHFLKMSGLAVACDDDGDKNPGINPLPGLRNGVFDCGGGDLGLLTYAYALEQLEADFYTRVITAGGFGSTWSSTEQTAITEIYRHEVVHRDYFRTLLNGLLPDAHTQLLPNLQFHWAGTDFSNRSAVLAMARTLEYTGVAAYNGVGPFIEDATLLNAAGKIVSVEGRHASLIRSMLGDDADAFGSDIHDPALPPSEILTAVSALNVIQTDFTAQYLP